MSKDAFIRGTKHQADRDQAKADWLENKLQELGVKSMNELTAIQCMNINIEISLYVAPTYEVLCETNASADYGTINRWTGD